MSGSFTQYPCPNCGFLHKNRNPATCEACGSPMEAAEFMKVVEGFPRDKREIGLTVSTKSFVPRRGIPS
jgi:peptide subunit release factor 1 (eRF1)